MKTADIQSGMICEGDYILDDGEYRKVEGFQILNEWALADSVVNFEDGGTMAIIEVKSKNIFLESEVIK